MIWITISDGIHTFAAALLTMAFLCPVIRQPSQWLLGLALFTASVSLACGAESFVELGDQGQLVYEQDDRGDRIMDFSSAGFRGGGVPIPQVPSRLMLEPQAGEDGWRIQAAIDHLSSMEPDGEGWRGALLLAPGKYEISGQLRIHTGGIVLRGSGQDADGTILLATGQGRRTLLHVEGSPEAFQGEEISLIPHYVPVGSTHLTVEDSSGFQIGQRVRIRRPSPQSWIDFMGMSSVEGRPTPTWKRDTVDVLWERTIQSMEGARMELDAPLSCSLDPAFGGGTVQAFQPSGRLLRVGIENLQLISQSDPVHPKDEEHAWMGVSMNHVEDAWVRQVTTRGFVSSAVQLLEHCRSITVMDCQNLDPVSELGGYRRHAFYTAGQQTLFLRCLSVEGRHDFSTGWRSAGPNAFVHCESRQAHAFSGPIESWSTGVLYDNVIMDGGGLRLDHRELWDNGVGWAAANSVLWQCSAPIVVNRAPPGAHNWAIGCWAQFVGNGHWRSSNEFVDPDSLYLYQLKERMGGDALRALEMQLISVDSLPSVWIAQTPAISQMPKQVSTARPLKLQDGWLVVGEQLAAGRQPGITWWRGHMSSSRANEFGVNLTRFAPGRMGRGLTDDLSELGRSMARGGGIALRHHPGLWYDRRRDDHEMIRRIDGDVWPPFYELPWARSGRGLAWDGLSLYDLESFNPWYFDRLRRFADISHKEGLILLNAMYFQHHILEAGAHWADYPWRTANNINLTGFAEPPPYVNRKRIFMDEAFYDVDHPVRRPLHQAYIRQCLSNLESCPNVIHLLGEEYSGPLHFAAFWLDTVKKWTEEKGTDPLIGLSAPKDVQDALLEDESRASLVDVIDFKYWWLSPKGLFAPEGGEHLAPRQHERLWRGGRPTDETLAEMAANYRKRYASKAVICDFEQASWAFLCAGGSLPNLPASTSPELLKAIPYMHPWMHDSNDSTWALWGNGRGGLIYHRGNRPLHLDLTDKAGSFEWIRLEGSTGRPVEESKQKLKGGQSTYLRMLDGKNLIWLRAITIDEASEVTVQSF